VTFRSFAEQVKNWLWLLGIQAGYEYASDRARWTHAEYVVDLVPIDASHARVMLTANGELLHASEPGPQTELGAKMLGDAIALWLGGPPDPEDEP
jgi:hypothetical protein